MLGSRWIRERRERVSVLPDQGMGETGERERESILGTKLAGCWEWVTGTLGDIACAGGRALGVDRAFLGNLTF